jgi:D-alanyl-D-alanine dipeptidase
MSAAGRSINVVIVVIVESWFNRRFAFARSLIFSGAWKQRCVLKWEPSTPNWAFQTHILLVVTLLASGLVAHTFIHLLGITNRLVLGVPLAVMSHLPDGFVYLSDIDGTVLQSVRYATSNNFLGRPVAGYESAKVILTEVAARALCEVQKDLQERCGDRYSLVVFDGYRPQTAVDDFIHWSKDGSDIKMKTEYYPTIEDKTKLFELGYIAARSSHSRGSTVDLSIALNTGVQGCFMDDLDMGSAFDVLDPISHFHCSTISAQAQQNRGLLRELMVEHNFEPYDEEWWHFSLREAPFPDTYFSFPVK